MRNIRNSIYNVWIIALVGELMKYSHITKNYFMRVFLLRHAHTAKALGDTSDFEREIDERGYSQLKELNQFLTENFKKTTFQVCCSPAQRTKTTYEIIESSIKVIEKTFANELYLPSREGLLKFLWNYKQATDDVLLISHNNGISDLASYLLNEPISLPTCGLLVINFEGIDNLSEISKGLGILEQSRFPN
jgi:phosphohistidine phosphatase